ncbi:MAG TPA: hypothetical protein VKA46_38305 [Gemmataceae bacterium]|nr:hypothetical protein [Gemmataceae bacterium]
MGKSVPVQLPSRRPARRPTVMDMRFQGDPWLEDARDGTLSVCVGNYPLAVLRGLSLDLPHLNGLLERLRHRGGCRA